MQPTRVYEYLVRSRQRMLNWARSLSAVDHERMFEIGRGSLVRTLAHMESSEWYYVERLCGREVPPYATWAIRDEDPPPLEVIERAWAAQEGVTRRAIGAVRDWDAAIHYTAEGDDARAVHVSASAADIFSQLALHEVHHRAQAMNMLRRLGVAVGDIDYNTMMYTRRGAG